MVAHGSSWQQAATAISSKAKGRRNAGLFREAWLWRRSVSRDQRATKAVVDAHGGEIDILVNGDVA
jgi:hypothetical protein